MKYKKTGFVYTFGYVLLSCLLFLSGCIATQVTGAQTNTLSSVDASCKPVNYKKVASSSKNRPSWVMVEPPDAGGTHYLVGMSAFHSTEREARDEAMKHAREEFAKYTGVEVNDLDQISKDIYGSSSGILDATISGKTQTTHETNAMVSRTKAKEWYFETLNANCGGKDFGTAYQYWVLAEVPLEEYDRVQAWKAKKESAKSAEKSAERERIKQEIDMINASHIKVLTEVETLISKADPASALRMLSGDWNTIYELIESLEKQPGVFSSELSQLQILMREIPSSMQKTLSNLVIDSGRGGTVWITSEGDESTEIRAWTWYKKDGKTIPVSGIPVLIKESGQKKVLANGRSDPNGQVLLEVNGLKPGNYDIFVDFQLGTVEQSERKFIAAGGTTIAVKTYKPDMQGAAKKGSYQLFQGPAVRPLPANKVVIGTVNYGTSRLGSEFSRRMETLIEREISQIPEITLIRRQGELKLASLEKIDQSRGIGITNNKTPVLPMNSPAIQAKLEGAEASLEVTYSIEGKHVNLDLSLIQSMTGKVLAAGGATINRSLIPSEIDVTPPSSGTIIDSTANGKGGEIKLELTTQRGDGATYAEGEKIQYYVSSNKDAYLLILYKDASDQLIQIYPNSKSGKAFHKAGDYFAIPDETMHFDFEIKPPFGIEQVLAFAATKPFPALNGNGMSNGLTVLDGDIKGMINQLRAHGQKPGVSYGEANVVVTTVKE